MASAGQKAKLGLFVLVGGALIAAMILVFSTISPFSRHAHYEVLVLDASGVDVGAPVYVRGVVAGSVSDIALGESEVRLTLAIDRQVAIPIDARAYLELSGFTGLKVVNVKGGSVEQGVLAPDSVIARGETVVDQLTGRTEALTADAAKLLAGANTMIAQLNELLARIEPERVATIVQAIERATQELAQASHGISGIVRDAERPTHEILANLEQTSRSAEEVVANLNETVIVVRGAVSGGDEDLQEALTSLRVTAKELESFSKALRRQPSLLLFGQPVRDRKLP